MAAGKNQKPIVNEGQRTIKFHTKDGQKRKVTCQVAAVNQILASVALVCDQGNDVIFRKDGGEIVNLATSSRTAFRRQGNIYVMDAWVPSSKEAEAESDAAKPAEQLASFARRERSR